LGVEFGLRTQKNLATHFRLRGRQVRHSPYNCPYDLLLDGSLRIEIKAANKQRKRGKKAPVWHFNIHRHGRLQENTTDWYVLCLNEIPFHVRTLYLAFRSPIQKTSLHFSLLSLMQGKAAIPAADFERLCCGEFSDPAHIELGVGFGPDSEAVA